MTIIENYFIDNNYFFRSVRSYAVTFVRSRRNRAVSGGPEVWPAVRMGESWRHLRICSDGSNAMFARFVFLMQFLMIETLIFVCSPMISMIRKIYISNNFSDGSNVVRYPMILMAYSQDLYF